MFRHMRFSGNFLFGIPTVQIMSLWGQQVGIPFHGYVYLPSSKDLEPPGLRAALADALQGTSEPEEALRVKTKQL